jgi:2-polyprenyl-3-methyl-5-hydroxy-6-metoxy-1,4-benzoquinol methylase
MVLKLTLKQQEMVKSYNQAISEGSVAIEDSPCLCSSKDFVKIADHDRYGFWHPVRVCKRCGLMMHNPHPTADSYSDFYTSDTYRKFYNEDNFIEQAPHRFKNNQGKQIAEALLPFIRERSASSILEIGCAGGWNLAHFDCEEYRVVGYDLGPGLVEFGKSQGLDLRVGSIKNVEGKYDVILLNHVVEHFTDFLGSMRDISKHLSPQGLMYVGVPNIDNFGLGQLQNAHVYYFSPRTFEYYMQVCGFKLVEFGPDQIHMYGIFELDDGVDNSIDLKEECDLILQKIKKGKIKDGIFSIIDTLGINRQFVSSQLKKLRGH